MKPNAQPGSKKRLLSRSAKKNIFIISFLTPTLIMFCGFYLYPLLNVFFTSFCKWDYTNIPNPQPYGLGELFTNYKYIFTVYPYFGEALRNSLGWAVLGMVVHVPVAVIVALALSRKLRGWKIVRNIYVIPTIISSAAMTMIFLQLYNPRYGIVNEIIRLFNPTFMDNILMIPGVNFFAITGTYILFAGYISILILGNMMTISTEIQEAAILDGATGWQQDWYITLPLSKGIIKTAMILASSAGFLLYNEVYLMTKGAAGTRSISFLIRDLAIISPKSQFSRANTVGVVQVVVGMLIIVFINIVFSIDWSEMKARRANKRRG